MAADFGGRADSKIPVVSWTAIAQDKLFARFEKV